MAKKIDPKQTKRAMAFGLWMNAPNPSTNKAYEIPLSDIQKRNCRIEVFQMFLLLIFRITS